MGITIGTDPLDPSSTFAVHVAGRDQQNVPPASAYAQLTATLNTLSATELGTVDVTAFTGVQFYAIINTGTTGARLSLVQLGFGNPSPLGAAFPREAIFHVRWDIGIPASGPTAPWEIWVDDLTFY